MQIFKIRQKSTGLFSTGGLDHTWEKIGKVYKNKQSLSAHLTLLRSNPRYKYKNPEDIEIVVYNVVEAETINIAEYGVKK